jgi:hypothetical protein
MYKYQKAFYDCCKAFISVSTHWFSCIGLSFLFLNPRFVVQLLSGQFSTLKTFYPCFFHHEMHGVCECEKKVSNKKNFGLKIFFNEKSFVRRTSVLGPIMLKRTYNHLRKISLKKCVCDGC